MKQKEYLKDRERQTGELKIYRKIAIPLSKIAAKTPITPNQITFLGLISTILMGIFLIIGTHPYLIAAAILIQLTIIFDYMDGTVARMKKMSSVFGGWLDIVVHHINFFALFFGATLGVLLNPPTYFLTLLTQYNIQFGSTIIWIIGFVGIFNFLTIMSLKISYIVMGQKKNIKSLKQKTGLEWGFKRFLLINKPFLANFFTIGFLLNQALLFLAIFALYSTIYLLAEIFYYSKKIIKYDQINS